MIKFKKNDDGFYEAFHGNDKEPYGAIYPSEGLPGGGKGKWACFIRGQIVVIERGLPKAKKFVKACF